jgi:hypothetical protein
MRFQIRDACPGNIVSEAQGDLRTGTDYWWGRGGMRLIKHRLLEVREQP